MALSNWLLENTSTVLQAVVASLILTVCVWVFSTPLRRVPGPWYTHFTGLVLTRNTLKGRRIHYIHRLHEIYGDVVRLGPNEVDVADLEAYHRIHKIGGGFLKSQWYYRFRPNAINVFNAIDPRVHAVRRRVLARPFSKSSLRQNWEPQIAEKVKAAVAGIRREAEAGCADIFKWWTLMATDTISRIAFGEDFGLLKDGLKNQYLRDLEISGKVRGVRAETGKLYPLFKPFALGFSTADKEAEARSHAIHARVAENAQSRTLEKANIFTDMLRTDRKAEDRISMHDIKYEAGALMVAGNGTTAVTLTYLIWAVLSDRRVRSTLEAELDALADGFNDAELEALPYLTAVIEETLRLYGSAPGSLPRVVPAGGLTVGENHLPAGTVVNTQAYTLHRDSRIYPDPLRFQPERWLDKESTRNAVTAAFGGGSRVCLGLHLAYMELRYSAAHFFRTCKTAQLAPETTPASMEPENFFLIIPAAKKCEIVM